jgi:hypothetical protein
MFRVSGISKLEIKKYIARLGRVSFAVTVLQILFSNANIPENLTMPALSKSWFT